MYNPTRKCKHIVYLLIYYGFLRYLPYNFIPVIGKLCRKLRYACCKRIFKSCGKNVNIERMAYFVDGSGIVVGDNSDLGINCHIPENTVIGSNVLMTPNVFILNRNHRFDRTDIPMNHQGLTEKKVTTIGDDVWIGRDVLMTPGRTIKTGTIIAAGCVLCKDFPEYSIVGGNPAKLIQSRK
ncbi:acetyltransferase [Spirochaetia bacterium]|nr:acetyltransferase [Spirochaetia bacterium]